MSDLPDLTFFRLADIFGPHDQARRAELLNKGHRLVHYTSATSAISIIQKKQVWMRNVRCMNDFMEVEHGFEMLQRAFAPPVDSETERGLRAVGSALNDIFPNIQNETIEWFDSSLFQLRHQTYVTCLSEHPRSEDAYGRLSMWRAYTGNQVGVALVIKPAPLYSLSDTFGAFSGPVHYYSDEEMKKVLLQVAANIAHDRTFLEEVGRDTVKAYFFTMLRSLVMCTKHPGFSEEKEWRIMHTQGIDDRGALVTSVESPGGIPQQVFKIPLEDHPQSGMVGIGIPELLERVIIGPTQYPAAVRDAMVLELEAAGIKDAADRVSYSNIPLRT
jgi:hypothetical protein